MEIERLKEALKKEMLARKEAERLLKAWITGKKTDLLDKTNELELACTELYFQNKEEQMTLNDSKLTIKFVLESSLAGFWDWNLLSNEEYLSPRFKEMFGYKEHEMENSPDSWQKIAFPEDLQVMIEAFDTHIKSKGAIPFKSIVRYNHKNGKIIWVRCIGKVVEWSKEESPTRAIGCHIDITEEKEKKQNRANELAIADIELAFQRREKQSRADELALADKELTFQQKEKQNRADELAIADKELLFQNEEKQNRADELAIADRELAFQQREKQNRADELALADKELAFQQKEKQNRADELTLVEIELINKSEEVEILSDELVTIDNELEFQQKEKQNRADELALVEIELINKSEEVEILSDELVIIDNELEFQQKEKQNRADELRRFIETANAPIFGIDNDGHVNEWNQSAEKITGFKRDEVLGKSLVESYITKDYQTVVEKVLKNALKGQETANYEFPLFTKEGKRVRVLLNSSARRNAEGKIVGVLGVGQDITILSEYKENLEIKVKNRTQELEESLEREKELGLLKTSFVSMASHQFRTPLTVIQSNSDLLEILSNSSGNKEAIKYKKATDRIKGEIIKMTTLIDEVLILGNLTSGNIHYSPEYFDLIKFCEILIKQFNSIQQDGRILKFEIEGKPCDTYLDSKLLSHALSNLISNAFKYSKGEDNPKLIVAFKPYEINLIVQDFGLGVPKDEIQNLFQPFFRANNTKEIKGTGLGLSIAKEYTEINKGTLTVDTTEGIGSSFEINFKKQEL